MPRPSSVVVVALSGLHLAACSPREDTPVEAYVRFHERAALAARGGAGVAPVLAMLTEESRTHLEGLAEAAKAALPEGAKAPTPGQVLLLARMTEAAVPRVELESQDGETAVLRVSGEQAQGSPVPAKVTLRREGGGWRVQLFESAPVAGGGGT